MQKACGYEVTIVSGATTFRKGETTGPLPRKLLRDFNYS